MKFKTELYYIELGETSEQFINRFFFNLFANYELDGYTIYAHNLGRFDSVFIIKALISNKNFSLTPIWKDDAILSLSIEHNGKIWILLDSYKLLPEKLESILKSFSCNIKKGHFPYSFVNQNNLFYIGEKPSKEFYNNIPDPEYLSISKKNWNLEKETLKYLKKDVEGLLEVTIKFRDTIHNKYNLNITKYKTLSSLALGLYTSNYISPDLIPELKMIKGGLENEIRSSYFGGNVEVFINEITKGYLYDINSQYPKAMLNDMPIGDPVYSLEKDLKKIFGFVFGEITCPNEQELQVPFIQYRNPFSNNVTCPRGNFSRLIFSEEVKYFALHRQSTDTNLKLNTVTSLKEVKDYSLNMLTITTRIKNCQRFSSKKNS